MFQLFLSSYGLALMIGCIAFRCTSAKLNGVLPQQQSLTKQSTCEDVLRWLPSKSRAEYPLLLQVVDRTYLLLQENFMVAMKNNSTLPVENIYLLCMDQESQMIVLTKYGFHCIEVNNVAGRKGVWKIRVHALACLVKAGKDVVVSDLDAVWLRDPIPALVPIKGDILLQRGNWPKKMQDPVTGMTMCMGFALFRAGSHGMSGFMTELLRLAWARNDDQIGLLYAAYGHGLRWDYDYSRSDMRLKESTRPGFGYVGDYNLTLTLLPHNQFVRKCFDLPLPEEAIVAHCTILDRDTDKIEKMKNESTWFLE